MIKNIPEVLEDRVINKEILYSDNSVMLDTKGKYLKSNTLLNVDKYSIEDAIRVILVSNPKVIVSTIQYDETNNKLFFFANKELDITSWNSKAIRSIKGIANTCELLENIKTILISDPPKEKGVISLYDVSKLLVSEDQRYSKIERNYASKLEESLQQKFTKSIVSIHQFDFKNKELSISFKCGRNNSFNEIIFKKRKNNELYIHKCENVLEKDDIFYCTGDIVSNLYDESLNCEGFIKGRSYNQVSSNSPFKINIGCYGVTIYCNTQGDWFKRLFELNHNSHNDVFNCECNSSAVTSLIKGNEEEILKRIYIRIMDCPEWMRDRLYEIREPQAEKEMKKYEKSLEVEESKTLQLIRRVFPFIKK